jgi:nicotinate phosphoribosyltransferase
VNIDYGPLLTDRYQLTMLQAYWQHGMHETAVFEFFVRKLPERRNFLVAAGLDQALAFLESAAFSPDDVEWLAEAQHFRPDFLRWLKDLRFSGDVNAMPEGTVFFPNEPILQVVAPLPEAQLVETRLINLLNFPTAVASKAARSVLAAPDKLLVEFGLRRAQGAEAALMAARASYIAGFQGTSNVLAGKLFDIPLFGTMAHSFVQAHDDEIAAFEHFADANSQDIVLLLDTYDTDAAARKVPRLATTLKERGIKIKGVRIDSGNLSTHAFNVRAILDEARLHDVTIFASGDLDEYALRDLIDNGAPIDGFGVGTKLDTIEDAPYLNCAYKLQEYAGRPRRKHSEGKATWPGRKQVYRKSDNANRMAGDVLALCDEVLADEPLLVPVMRGGKRLAPPQPIAALRQYAATQLARLPDRSRALDRAEPFEVTISTSLRDCVRALDEWNVKSQTLKLV